MANTIQAVRGMNDILPDKTPYWGQLEEIIRETVKQYGYQEIRFPLVESTPLFKRSIGEATDIVEKEMYTFDDRNGDSLTLRPEGTAVCVRACLEHGLLHNQTQRLWYAGPMFRYERPQKGRYRQFHQFGIEAFGMVGPDIDAEIILLSARFLKALGLADKIELQLNTLGTKASRAAYRSILVNYFEQHRVQLDEDSQRRLVSNPLRILDSKNPAMQKIIAGAPKMLDYLDEVSAEHFAVLRHLLDATGVRYVINPKLVRGLDYYSLTVFEWVTTELGAQGTVCAGGRYDELVELLGGKPTPAIGFACGLERLVLLLEQLNQNSVVPDIFMILHGASAVQQGLILSERIRDNFPHLQVETNLSGGSMKSQFKRADKSAARFAIIIGEDEAQKNQAVIKNLRDKDGAQQQLSYDELINFLMRSK